MKNLLTLIILSFVCAASISQLSAQENKENIKVIVIEKTESEDGTMTMTKVIKEGEEARRYLEELEENSDVDLSEVTILKNQSYKLITTDEEGNTRIVEWYGENDMTDEHRKLLEEGGLDMEKEIEVETTTTGEMKQKMLVKILTDEAGEEKVMEFRFKGDEMPEDVRKLLEEENIQLILKEDGDDVDVVIDKEEKNSNKAQLGVYIQDHEDGVEVTKTMEGSAAEKAGIKPGHVITRVNDTVVESLEDLIESLSPYKPADIVIIETLENGKKKAFEVTLQERKELFQYKTWKEVEATREDKIDSDGKKKRTTKEIIIKKEKQ